VRTWLACMQETFPATTHAMQVSIWCSLPNTTECNGVLRVRCAVNTNFAM